MRILTYANPFEINRNKELWDIITKYPHYCASDTLVQGLESEYGRMHFGILRTVKSLIDNVLKEYKDNPQADIQLFLTVANIIRTIKGADAKAAFRFNIAYVVEAIKILALLECDSTKFQGELNEDQRILLYIYDQVVKSGCLASLENCKQLDKDDFIRSARITINDEIGYLCNTNPGYKQLGFSLPLRTPRDGHEAILKIIEHLRGKMEKAPEDEFMPLSIDAELARAEHIKKLIENRDDSIFDQVIIHGVHKITPDMFFLFKTLEKIGVEVIFLINYAGNLPKLYRTWKEVYSWCDTRFEFEEDLDMSSGNNLGLAIATLIEGHKISRRPVEKLTIYRNLTSFTDWEVRKTFKKAQETLNKMPTQYYAVRGESSNEILKMYFPDQFKQKPFLSYPIGQFILGIYQMWDFETNTLLLSESSLSECAVSNLFKGSGKTNMLEIIRKIRLYFSDIEAISDYYTRIGELETALQIICMNNHFIPLQKLSFFNITLTELSDFKSFLEFIKDIADRMFKDESSTIDFGKHFKTLMDIISVPSVGSGILSDTENSLISEISEKLNKCPEGQVKGNIEDVKEALSFYLAGNKKEDTSNWIVRDFEQIDGAVLLRKRSKAKHYHFALLSNEHMTSQKDDALPWPLTNEMFIGYIDAASAVPIITKGLLERRNFLKFSLFYGTFFTKCGIKLSFIQEEDDEEQSPYYLFNALGLETELFHEDGITTFMVDDDDEKEPGFFSSARLDAESREMFSICPYKYLQNVVIKAPIEYYSDYHVKYYVANFMAALIKGKYRLDSKSLKAISGEFETARKLFPFWNEVVFTDIKNNTIKQLAESKSNSDPFIQNIHEQRKQNFLIAQWKDPDGNKQMIYDRDGLTNKISEYMTSAQLYPYRNELPHKKVCENCNYNEVCLRNYYEARTSLEEEEAMDGHN